MPASKERTGALILTLRDDTRMIELQDSVRLAQTWTAMGSLVAGVAHEVRNPLFAISANVDALVAVLGNRTKVADLIAALRHERGRLSRLMDDLLLYGHPVSPVEMRPAPIGPVLQAALEHCRPLAAARAVRISLEGQGATVRGHRDRLEEVFVNLIENACQHSPKGSQVRVELERRNGPGGARLVCRVRDAGPGFPADALPRLFEPFFTRRKGGTGLGLAIVQRLVVEHGGQVSAENHPEGGAVVNVVLPIVVDPPAPA